MAISSVLNLFRFQGRTSRSGFWLTLVGLNALQALLVFAMNAATGHLGGGSHAQEMTALLFLWPHAALVVRRGHDLGRSARYSLAIVVAATVGFTVVIIGRWMDQFGLSLIGAALWLWAMFHLLIEYGLRNALADDALPGGKASA